MKIPELDIDKVLKALTGYDSHAKWETFYCRKCGRPDYGVAMDGICAMCWSKDSKK